MTEIRLQVRRVLLITLGLNLAVAAGKIVLGLLTGALAIVADGFHSLTDSAGNVAGLIANHFAAQPPDDIHPYGHRRMETLAALLIGGLLMLTALEIGRGAVERLQNNALPDITPLSLAVLLATLVINIFVSRYQIAQGTRLHSEVLLADAKHTGADVYVTISVLISIVIVALTGWWWVDVVTALVVMFLIARAAWQILRQTGNVLVDAAPYAPEQLTSILSDVPGIGRILRARSRGTTDAPRIDIDVQVAPEMTAEHTEHLTGAIRQRLTEHLGSVEEVEVHFVPQPNGRPNPVLTARAAADALGLTTHEVQVSGSVLEMHVEVSPGQTLAAAHQQVSRLEDEMRERLPEVEHVVTHIEPAAIMTESSEDTGLLRQSALIEKQARDLLNVHYPHTGWHDLRVCPTLTGFTLMLHAALPPEMSVEAAHDVAENAETLLRGQIPLLTRVTIHTEPFGD